MEYDPPPTPAIMAPESIAVFLATNVFPFIGILISLWLFTVPYKEVKLARKRGDVGPINYWVILVMWLNSILWTIYSFIIADYKTFFWVSPQVFTFLYFNLSLLSTLNNEFPRKETFGLETGMVCGVMAILALCAVQQFIFPNHAKTIFGSIGTCTSILSNASPLSTLRHVIQHRDSSRIHFGIAIASFTNMAFWELYALVLQDWNYVASTSVSLFLTGVQVLLCCCFGRKEENEAHTENGACLGMEDEETKHVPPKIELCSSVLLQA
jgi:hypothetical protein